MSKRKGSESSSAGLKTPNQVKSKPFVSRSLKDISPLKEQFEPKGSDAVRQRNKMGGGS